MTTKLPCEEARELAAEMALGTLAGDERVRLIPHLSTCSECRTLVEELSEIVDSMLLLGPEREPPAGFESAFLAQFKAPARRNRMRWVVTAAAASVVALVAAGAVWVATSEERNLGESYQHALDEANGKYFGVKPLRSMQGTKVGNVFAYEGQPSWVFVVFEDSVVAGDYDAEVTMRDGERSALGPLTIDEDALTWGADLEGSLHDVAAVTFMADDGGMLEARFPRD